MLACSPSRMHSGNILASPKSYDCYVAMLSVHRYKRPLEETSFVFAFVFSVFFTFWQSATPCYIPVMKLCVAYQDLRETGP